MVFTHGILRILTGNWLMALSSKPDFDLMSFMDGTSNPGKIPAAASVGTLCPMDENTSPTLLGRFVTALAASEMMSLPYTSRGYVFVGAGDALAWCNASSVRKAALSDVLGGFMVVELEVQSYGKAQQPWLPFVGWDWSKP